MSTDTAEKIAAEPGTNVLEVKTTNGNALEATASLENSHPVLFNALVIERPESGQSEHGQPSIGQATAHDRPR